MTVSPILNPFASTPPGCAAAEGDCAWGCPAPGRADAQQVADNGAGKTHARLRFTVGKRFDVTQAGVATRAFRQSQRSMAIGTLVQLADRWLLGLCRRGHGKHPKNAMDGAAANDQSLHIDCFIRPPLWLDSKLTLIESPESASEPRRTHLYFFGRLPAPKLLCSHWLPCYHWRAIVCELIRIILIQSTRILKVMSLTFLSLGMMRACQLSRIVDHSNMQSSRIWPTKNC